MNQDLDAVLREVAQVCRDKKCSAELAEELYQAFAKFPITVERHRFLALCGHGLQPGDTSRYRL